jgi:hypothetical protein
MKWVFPTLWIGGFGLGTCAMWLSALQDRGGNPPPEFVKFAFLAAWLIGSSFIIWFCRRLKRVQVDEEALYVSNYWSEVRIPLAEVSHLTQSYMSRPPTITIHLRGMSSIGQRIVFIPKFRWVLFGTHPVITELQALCDRAKAHDGNDDQGPQLRVDSKIPMRVLQAICALFCLLCIVSAVTGIQSVVATDRVVITRYGENGRLWAVATAMFFAAAIYGIQRRAILAWKLGWVVLATMFLRCATLALRGLLQPQHNWIDSCFLGIGGIVVTVVWGLWWNRQRGYFEPHDASNVQGRDK